MKNVVKVAFDLEYSSSPWFLANIRLQYNSLCFDKSRVEVTDTGNKMQGHSDFGEKHET
jgi:hypothetical protein